MILVDTSVWIDHFAHGEPNLSRLLESYQVLIHPWVTGEIMMGNVRDRPGTATLLGGLSPAPIAAVDEVLALVERERLFGLGIGFIDGQLLASARLASGSLLWTRDRRLLKAATSMGLAWVSPPEAQELT